MVEDNSLKKALSEGLNEAKKQSIDPDVAEKIEEIKEEFSEVIPELAKEYDNKIPFKVIHEETGLDYKIISDVLLNMTLSGVLLGFISDQGTDDYSDDILHIRTERMVDKLEPEYETG